MRMAFPVLYLPFHLIQSALGQKVEAKPGSPFPRERRQGRAARAGREVACLAGRMGSRSSRAGGRASPHRAKSASRSAQSGFLVAAHAVGCAQSVAMLHAITLDRWLVRFTDEVPRRQAAPRSVRASYKMITKGKPHAPVPGTRSRWPRFRGCQQIQSSLALRPDQRCNRYRRFAAVFVMEKVSLAAAATKWPDGTSSRQPVVPLRNISQHGRCLRPANPLR